ncbi:MAG: hypothetical protein JST65_12365 [Acidobacteria bacterium]|nr:hypothetical protein [Acidobacteriota bacterium]
MILEAGDWTVLEVVKLSVGICTPLVVAIVGYWLSLRLKQIEQTNWGNQKLVERRIQFYVDVVPLLNDLLCYMTYVGSWKELAPDEVVAAKRKLDRAFYVYSPLFPPGLMSRYIHFVNCCFRTFTGWGSNARLRTDFFRRKATRKDWVPEWEALFAPDDVLELPEIQAAYNALIQTLAEALGVGIVDPHLPAGQLPGGSTRQLLPDGAPWNNRARPDAF